MRITYARVWMRLIRIESELAGFAFNALLNSHSCRQALDSGSNIVNAAERLQMTTLA